MRVPTSMTRSPASGPRRRGGRCGGRSRSAQRAPGKSGARRSLKAAMPSAISGDVVAMAWACPSRSREAASGVSKVALRSALDRPSDRVGPAASRPASSCGGAVELFDGGQAAVGQAEVDRFGARRPLAQHDHGLGPGQADQAGEEVGTAGVDHQSPAGEGPDELGLLAGEHEVTGEGQVRAGADGGAVDGGHGRLVELPELSDEGLDPDPERLARGPGVEPFAAGAAHGGLAEVHAGAEGVAHPGDEEGTARRRRRGPGARGRGCRRASRRSRRSWPRAGRG